MKFYDNRREDYKEIIEVYRKRYMLGLKIVSIVNILMLLMILYSLNFIVFLIYSILISMIVVIVISIIWGIAQYKIENMDLLAVEKIDNIINERLREKEKINFDIIADISEISKSFIYDNKYLRGRIEDIIYLTEEVKYKPLE
ncbi:transposase C for [Clostridium putrefaciens]|uniref:Transposase C for n=1 Tax=Clostridium putrefaciens TaxID=99675 RepID=A0A381J9W7_9CLOT|nr:hypothetical protein [Clostridium putrefaciens]SUY48060.1 transposase C for [Clostridium putrefaciens]